MTTILFVLVALIFLLSVGAYFGVRLVQLKVKDLEMTMVRRFELLHAMQYNVMRKQGWSHEELSEAFPVKGLGS